MKIRDTSYIKGKKKHNTALSGIGQGDLVTSVLSIHSADNLFGNTSVS